MQRFSGLDYLRIDIASNFGLDKKTWDERIAWVKENESNLEEMLSKAEEPALYFAGVQAYRETQRGHATGYPISLDATASGLQILACLTGDRQAAELCNVVDTGTRVDAYTVVYDEMLRRLSETPKIKREDVKQAIMTSLYGSKAVPKEVFGEGKLLDCFQSTMADWAPAVWALNEVMIDIWNPHALSNDWVMPDNFHVHCKVMDSINETVHFLNEPFQVTRKVNQPMAEGRSLGANITHSIDGMMVREILRRCDYDPMQMLKVRGLLDESPIGHKAETNSKNDRMVVILWKHYLDSGYLSVRILDHLNHHTIGHVDPNIIRTMLDDMPEKPFKVMAIHDCFRCLPNYGDDLRVQYNLQLTMIAKSNLLGFLVGQLLGQKLAPGKLDSTLQYDTLAANYALS